MSVMMRAHQKIYIYKMKLNYTDGWFYYRKLQDSVSYANDHYGLKSQRSFPYNTCIVSIWLRLLWLLSYAKLQMVMKK